MKKFDFKTILELLANFMPNSWQKKLQTLPKWVFALVGALLAGLLTFITWATSQQIDTTLLTAAAAILLWFQGYDPNKPQPTDGKADDSFKG